MDSKLLIALSGAIPALVAMWLVDRLDRKRPEPPGTRRLVAFVGILSVIPAIILELVVAESVGGDLAPQMTYEGSTFHAFGVAAAIEEACKIAVVYIVVWNRPEFDERMDGIVYGSRAGLGFALVENVMYLLSQADLSQQITVWVLRALLAVPGHALWSGMIGAFAARRRFDRAGIGLLGGYLLAVSFHGLYDLSVFAQTPMRLEGHDVLARALIAVPILLTIAAFLVVRRLARTALRLDDADAARAALSAARAGRSGDRSGSADDGDRAGGAA
ncbi:MAG: PrsW family intramembrane metalloprotease [Deltaproteobacteria bacterium]|nr:PrsW family intramembrane metalloprotease [Deltaproteobacteria bacterium]